MKLGFIILAHHNLHRTGQLVRFLAKDGCPVSLHIDQTASPKEVSELKASLNHIKNVVYPKREKCEWGQFSIVQATLNAAELLLSEHPDVTNVFLASGSCLPARPIKQLKAFLERHEDIDFIESFSVTDKKWVKGGLDKERFSLFFPLSWRKHRYAFDRLVDIQRFLGINRRTPEHISPHLGSQWWCLTSKTLRKTIEDPKKLQNDQYFSRNWIPDESYFQSLAHNHSQHIRSESLTFSAFNSKGKPFLFYDDHLDSLSKTSAFFIRKAWPGANKLYRELLTTNRKNLPLSEANNEEFSKIFSDANDRRHFGGEGRFLQGRFPKADAKIASMGSSDFVVLTGFNILFQDFMEWAHETKGLNVFGNLFARRHFTFRNKIALLKGNLTANMKLRNANPKSFLSNFLWSQKSDNRVAIQFDVTDTQNIMPHIASDNRANFVIVREAWLLSIANSHIKFKGKLMNAKVLQAREKNFLKALDENQHAGCCIFSLEEALNTPGLVFQAALQALDPEMGNKPTTIPLLNDISELDTLVRKLEKNGISLDYKPSKKKKEVQQPLEQAVSRPYVVK